MKLNKGDLIIIDTIEDKKQTCIVLSVFEGAKYIYTYCIDSCSYRLVYNKDVDFVVSKDFYPNFPLDDLCNIDYSFYDSVVYDFSYTPFGKIDFDDEDA